MSSYISQFFENYEDTDLSFITRLTLGFNKVNKHKLKLSF